MSSLEAKAILAGILFGAWPLLINKSGLSGNLCSMVFSCFVFLFIVPFALFEGTGNIKNANWGMLILAAGIGALGIILFNGMLIKAEPKDLGSLFILTTIMQMVVPVIYQIISDGNLTVTKGVGFLFAAIAAILLLK